MGLAVHWEVRRSLVRGAGRPARQPSALDHVLLLSEHQLEDVAQDYALYFNTARPHQGIGQRIPDGPANDNGKIIAIGSDSDVKLLIGANTRVIDAKERCGRRSE